MSPKQYKLTERLLEGLIATVVLSGIAVLLLGVYALASLVL